MQSVKLYRKNSLGVGEWEIYALPSNGTKGTIIVRHAVCEGGSLVTHEVPVVTNQSGRTLEQQIELEMRSRINRQMDKGYKLTREAAQSGATNQLNLVNPMLAQKLKDVTITQSDLEDAFVQPKLDGHRCLITKRDGDMVAYSRKGKTISTVPHILEDCYEWMQDGDTIDGELYRHGVALQDIGSAIKRQQESSGQLTFCWYDMVLPVSYARRLDVMRDLAANVKCSQIQLVPTERVTRMAEVYAYFKKCRDMGYEGSMLRLSVAGYEDGKRPRQLLKVKEREDAEVTVLSGRPATNGAAILRVRTDWDVEFDVLAPGSLPEKQVVMEQIEKYVGERLTIEYACLTNDRVPFHCVATRWREDV